MGSGCSRLERAQFFDIIKVQNLLKFNFTSSIFKAKSELNAMELDQ